MATWVIYILVVLCVIMALYVMIDIVKSGPDRSTAVAAIFGIIPLIIVLHQVTPTDNHGNTPTPVSLPAQSPRLAPTSTPSPMPGGAEPRTPPQMLQSAPASAPTIMPAVGQCPWTSSDAAAQFGGSEPEWSSLDSSEWIYHATDGVTGSFLSVPKGMTADWRDGSDYMHDSEGPTTIGPTTDATVRIMQCRGT